MTEWQWNTQVVISHVNTTHERFPLPQDKATVWKDAVTPREEEKKNKKSDETLQVVDRITVKNIAWYSKSKTIKIH